VCWMCGHPGATERDYTDHLRRLIDTRGWAVQGVERDGARPPWAYTVGLTPHLRPELVVTGMGLVRAAEVLNLAAGHLVHADKHGHWPWDRAYRGVRGGQPVLGTREPLERRRRVG
jgi:uncharacterized protein DUF4262